MTTLADKSLLSGGDNKPPMLEKHLYDSWKSRMELYMRKTTWKNDSLASIVTSKEKHHSSKDFQTGNLFLSESHIVCKRSWEKIKQLIQENTLTKQERSASCMMNSDKYTYKERKTLHEYYLEGDKRHKNAGTTRKNTPGAKWKQHGETTDCAISVTNAKGAQDQWSSFNRVRYSIFGRSRTSLTFKPLNVITHNDAYQPMIWNAYDSDCDELNQADDCSHGANLSRNGSMHSLSEHAYWKATSVPALDPSHSSTTIKVEVPKEPGLVISSPKNELRKLKGKALDKVATKTHSVDPKVSKDNMEPITPKLLNKKDYSLPHILTYPGKAWSHRI
ncbi:hypothetical protein Tco_1056422 [Tanacetum coccineum]|uniref:Uncharacterized protein n=1 Tax=Tanacetum coccineum TaxID=301880 RepID=A0ABQ5H3Y3_9ASTR